MLPKQHKGEYILAVSHGHRLYTIGTTFARLTSAVDAANGLLKAQRKSANSPGPKPVVSILRIVEVIDGEQ